MTNEPAPQGIPVSKELAAQIQRLAVKFQSFDLTYIELKEQIDSVTKALLVKINASENEKAELQKKLEAYEKPKAEKYK
jgi:predicted outer membrane protein